MVAVLAVAGTACEPQTLPGTTPPHTEPSVSGSCFRESTVADEVAFELTGVAGGALGGSVAAVGDVDGDGFADAAVGASGANEGTALVVLGDADVAALAGRMVTLTGDGDGDAFGFAVASAGDIDDDGFDDLLVTAPFADNVAEDGGLVALYFGGPAGPVEPPMVFAGDVDGGNLGHASGAGDLDGDGALDVLIAAEVGIDRAGGVFLVRGPTMRQTTGPVVVPAQADVQFTTDAGNELSRTTGPADLDGDGINDVIVAARREENEAGAVYVYRGSAHLPPVLATADGSWDARYVGYRASITGHALAAANDLDGDGRDDLVIAAPHDAIVDAGRGAAYVVAGFPEGARVLADVAYARFDGEQAFDRFATDVAPGDIDQDGAVDLFVGAKWEPTGGQKSGTLYVLRGPFEPGAMVVSSPDGHISATGANDVLGTAVAVVGDMNRDGVNDLVAGARGWGGDAGAAYLLWCGLSEAPQHL